MLSKKVSTWYPKNLLLYMHGWPFRCLPFSLILLSSWCFGQQFSKSPAVFTGVLNSKVVFGDFDNDGHTDLLVVGSILGGAPSVLYKNDGAGNFTAVNNTLPRGDGEVELNDYNRDGMLDILMTQASNFFIGSNTYLLKNKGNFIFEAIISLPGSDLASFGDYDNDGDQDALMIGSSSHDIYQNNDGNFSAIGINGNAGASFAGSAEWMDYDIDGDLDYFVTDRLSNRLVIFRNDGFEQFTPLPVGSAQVNVRDAKWVNINNDGLPDILMSGYSGANSSEFFEVLLQQPDHQFQTLNYSFEGFSTGEALPFDADNDGDMDLLVAGARTGGDQMSLALLYTNTGGAFTLSNSGLPPMRNVSIAAADVDHDNDLDIIITGAPNPGPNDFTNTFLYLNNGVAKNTAPQPPVSLTAVVDGQKATISWASGTDAETPSGGLTYNVYVGTSPSIYNVLAPLASDGFVKAARFANAGYGLSRIVENLAPGTYYYRVQTIDGAQGASALTNEMQFTVLAEPPVINGFSPASAVQGQTIRVSGKNFSNTSAVSINDVPASFRIVNSSSMMVTVPSVKWSGKIKISTTLGTATSAQDFCEKPKPTEISGELQPCFGFDKVYKVIDLLDGLAYHWTVDNGATIVAQDGGEITVRFQQAGAFHVTVYPESCVAGDQRTLIVDAQGPPTVPINGPSDVLSDVTKSYGIPDSYRGYGFIFEWQKDGVIVASGVDNNLTGIAWSDPGVHTVTLYLQRPPNSFCATSRAESKLTANVALNQYSLGQKILLDGPPSSAPTLAADLDGDGDDDLLEGARIFENTGGTLVARAAFTTMPVASITPLDIDNDNDVDLLMRGATPSDGRLFRNDGNLSFTQVWTTTSITNNQSTPIPIDYNADGKIDVAANGYIFDNATNGFGSPKALLEPGAGVFTDVIDFNRDGYPDILTNNGMLHLNSGPAEAGFHLDYSLSFLNTPGASTSSFHYADMNSDGVDDVLFGLNHRIGANFEDGNGAIEISDTGPADDNVPFYADLNLDGIRDILFGALGNVYSQGYIYQRGSNRFKKTFELTLESVPFDFLDIDGDGKDELLTIYRDFARDPSHFYIAVNTNNGQKPVVPAPANLTSVPGTSSVDLSWDATNGYTYNVAVGSAPGTANIVSPLADLSTGHGFIHSKGNARINFLTLNLPPGTYFWSVQSIHAAGTRSAFHSWQSFTVDSRPGSPSNLTFSTEPPGIGVKWTDNESSETGFLVERKSGVGEPFVSVQNLPANSTQFIDPGGDTSSETFYRVTAQVATPSGLPSKVGGTGAALVHRFPYNENFEKQPTFPVWTVDPSGPEFTWQKIASASRKNGEHSMTSFGGALISPEFDLTGLEYPTFKFVVLGGFSGPGGIVQSSIDGGQTWSTLFGVEYPRLYYDADFATYRVTGVPKNSSVRFRIKGGAFASIDDISVVNAPSPVQGLTVTQSAQGEAHLEWNEVPDATHYFISRTPSTGTLYVDTVAAPLHSSFDHNITAPNTYSYQVLAYSKTVNEYALAYSSLEPVTLVNIPFSVQSVDPVSMQANGLKEIPLHLHAGSTPVSQVTVTASSSNPNIQNVSVVRNGEEVSMVIQADNYVGETTITISASFSSLSDSKSFKVTVYPQTAAPTGNSAQSFCYNNTVTDLAVTGSSLKWFSVATGGTALPGWTLLENGKHYYASQTLNGFESTARLDVVVSIGTAAPTGISSQSFCYGATVANLSVTGSAVKWYNAPSGGGSFLSTAPLVDGLHYYATQSLNGCASQSRLDVTVSVGSPAPSGSTSQSFCFGATVASLQATGTAIKWYSTATSGSSLPPSTSLINGAHFFATQTVNGCESLARLDVVVTVGVPAPTGPSSKVLCSGATVSGLPATGSDIKWYSAATGGSTLAISALLVNGAHYYASQTVNGCESQSRLDVAVTIGVPATPTGSSAQVFCSGATVSSLVATGTNIKWYTVPSGGSPLSSAATLTDGSHYYASQTVNACQSLRLDVIVSVNVVSKPTGNSLQIFCPGSTIANFVVAGVDIKWYNAASGGAALSLTDLLIRNAHYFASQTIGGCESQRLDVTDSLISTSKPTGNASQSFCPGSILANVAVSGNSVKWYNSPSGGALISLSTLLVQGTHYYATQMVNGCESPRLDVFVSVGDTPKPSGQSTQTICAGTVIGNLLVSGPTIRWYRDATGGAALPSATLLTNTQSLYATQTINGCESTDRLKVTVTVNPVPDPPSGETQQTLDKGKTVANLSVIGANIKWYATQDDIAAKKTLPSGTTLANAVYYATQSVTGCESVPLAVSVTLKDLITGIESERFNYGAAMYPNPVGDELTITHDEMIDNIIVINQFGQQVVDKSIHAKVAKLDVSGLAKGVYTVQVHTSAGIVTMRVMKL